MRTELKHEAKKPAKHPRSTPASTPTSAGSGLSFELRTISSSADRARPGRWRAAWPRPARPPSCCSRPAGPMTCQASATRDNGTPISRRTWGFEAVLNPRLNGRRLPLSMGRVLGGGSSINVMGWARGHKNDRDYFAEEAGDTGALVTRVVLEGKRAVGVEFPPRGRNPSYQGAPPDRAFAWRHQHAQGADAIGHRR